MNNINNLYNMPKWPGFYNPNQMMNNYNNISNLTKKTVTFNITHGFSHKISIFIDYHSISYIFRYYLEEIDYLKLYYSNLIKFLYKGKEIDTDLGKADAKELFQFDQNQIIVVVDIDNLIKPFQFNFQLNSGYKLKIIASSEKSIDGLLIKYLYKKDYHTELIDRNDKIKFLNSKELKF